LCTPLHPSPFFVIDYDRMCGAPLPGHFLTFDFFPWRGGPPGQKNCCFHKNVFYSTLISMAVRSCALFFGMILPMQSVRIPSYIPVPLPSHPVSAIPQTLLNRIHALPADPFKVWIWQMCFVWKASFCPCPYPRTRRFPRRPCFLWCGILADFNERPSVGGGVVRTLGFSFVLMWFFPFFYGQYTNGGSGRFLVLKRSVRAPFQNNFSRKARSVF